MEKVAVKHSQKTKNIHSLKNHTMLKNKAKQQNMFHVKIIKTQQKKNRKTNKMRMQTQKRKKKQKKFFSF